jgi:hypothetical protein
MAKVQAMRSPNHDRARQPEKEFESLVVDLFRRAGWRVEEQPGGGKADLLVESGGRKYVIEVKRSAESRPDRLVPLLSQAIIQAQSAARHMSNSAIPVAIVGSPHISSSVAEQVKQFAASYVPDVGIGVIDSQGFRAFHGFGLEKFNSERSKSPEVELPAQLDSPSDLFSDLNQWMLKILVGQNIPESLLSVPRGEYRSGRQLAEAGGVSPMSASRLLRQLSSEGFLDESKDALRLVRVEELMRRWLAASHRSVREVPVRWIIRGGKDQLESAVRSYVSWLGDKSPRKGKQRSGRLVGPAPRTCIALFAAADSLGFGFVRGAVPHIYLEQFDAVALEHIGLSAREPEGPPDVYIRIPENKEAVFRSAVQRNGVLVSDILQVWLDVSNHPTRGKEQGDEIWRRVLAPSLLKGRP